MISKSVGNNRRFEELKYYYLLSIVRGFDIYIYTINIFKEVNRVQVFLASNQYIIGEKGSYKITDEGNKYMLKLQKELNLKGIEKYLIPDYKRQV
ncbi:hypothetical protein PT110_09180 [Erysipelothrix rhusiopathiae]|nr:hypothetical protein [Erysipelothrix rhusiopathiae]